MICKDIVIIPSSISQHEERNKIRYNWKKDVCVFFFAGLTSFNSQSKTRLPCADMSRITNASTKDLYDYILLPIVDSYYNLGRKMIHMIRWIHNLDNDNILYLDMDTAQTKSVQQIHEMFSEMRPFSRQPFYLEMFWIV